MTAKQIVLVAKDRAADELTDLVDTAHGFFNLKGKEKQRAIRIARFIGDVNASVDEADKLGFINGEEGNFFQ